MRDNQLPRVQWSSYYSYILVTTGAIVGLGNVFHFPYLVAKFGGLFVLFYVASELFMSIPLLFAELVIGRRGKQNPVGAISILSIESGASRYWRLIGWLCFLILFLTLSYYTVEVAFPLGYLLNTIHILSIHGIAPDFTSLNYTNVTQNFVPLESCFFIFLFITMAVVARGINRGLEGISKLTVPTYFIILFVLAVYAGMSGSFLSSVSYMFHIPDNQPLWPVALAALTFAFFKLNIGMGSMMVYGSYLPYSVPLAQSTVIILIIDAIASLLSYFIIAPLMLHSGIVSANNTLSYHDAMLVFTSVPHGMIIAILFFAAAVIAAWTPTIAMAESAALILIERLSLTRIHASIIVGVGAILVGTLSVLSRTDWSSIIIFSTWTVEGFIENLAAELITPLSAFLISIFSGWIIARQIISSELTFKPGLFYLWRFLVRYLAPICIAVIFFSIGFN